MENTVSTSKEDLTETSVEEEVLEDGQEEEKEERVLRKITITFTDAHREPEVEWKGVWGGKHVTNLSKFIIRAYKRRKRELIQGTIKEE